MVKQIDDQTKIREYPVKTSNDSFYQWHVELKGMERSLVHDLLLHSFLSVYTVPNENSTFELFSRGFVPFFTPGKVGDGGRKTL